MVSFSDSSKNLPNNFPLKNVLSYSHHICSSPRLQIHELWLILSGFYTATSSNARLCTSIWVSCIMVTSGCYNSFLYFVWCIIFGVNHCAQIQSWRFGVSILFWNVCLQQEHRSNLSNLSFRDRAPLDVQHEFGLPAFILTVPYSNLK
jgi:hypothetical protein